MIRRLRNLLADPVEVQGISIPFGEAADVDLPKGQPTPFGLADETEAPPSKAVKAATDTPPATTGKEGS